jgi:hypothetical protein
VAYSDRHIRDWSHPELIGLYVVLAREFRAYIDREKPDVFIFNCVASQYAHLLYLILQDNGVRVLIPMHSGIEDLFYLSDNPYYEWPEVSALYTAMKQGSAACRPEEERWARAFIDEVRTGTPPYSTASAKALEQRKFSIPGPTRLASYLRYFANYVRYDSRDPTLPSPSKRLASVVRLRRNRVSSIPYFQDVSAIDAPFILFPLHYEPEIATLVLSQYEQASAIDFIARQLPLSWRLVLKEHPVMVGQRPWSFYKEMTERYPNLMFVDPAASVNALARRAGMVFSLSGTAILEALILQRPVIFTSRSRFGGFGLGTLTHDLIDFGAALASAKTALASDAELVFMLAAIHRHCTRFKFAEPLGDASVLADQNIEKIAFAVLERLNGR